MPPKTKSSKKREVKPKKPRQKQKQKQKQQQNVKVMVTQGGSGGGGTPIIIPAQTPIQFRDTSGENVKLTGLIKNLEDRIAGFKQPVATAPVFNPANDRITTSSVFNAPITYNDDLAEEVIRDINNLNIKAKPIAKPVKIPEVFNAPITTKSLFEQIAKTQPPPEAYAGLEPPSPEIEKRRSDFGKQRGSTKEKYKKVGFEEGVPVGRDIQNEFVMGVEQSAKIPAVFRVTPNEENQPASSSSVLNFA